MSALRRRPWKSSATSGWRRPVCAQPREQVRRHAEAAELAARKNVDVVDALVAAQERGPFGIDHPGNFGLRVGVAEERGGGQSVHNVAERTRFDDKDGGNVGFQNQLVIPSAIEGSRRETLKETPRDPSTPLRSARDDIRGRALSPNDRPTADRRDDRAGRPDGFFSAWSRGRIRPGVARRPGGRCRRCSRRRASRGRAAGRRCRD